MKDSLRELTEAITKAVPEKGPYLRCTCGFMVRKSAEECGGDWCPDCKGKMIQGNIDPDITLEDVLRSFDTLEMSSLFEYWTTGGLFFIKDSDANNAQWTLGLPLSSQPQPTIDFLHKLLV